MFYILAANTGRERRPDFWPPLSRGVLMGVKKRHPVITASDHGPCHGRDVWPPFSRAVLMGVKSAPLITTREHGRQK